MLQSSTDHYSCRQWGRPRAVPEEHSSCRWNLVLWMEQVDGGFGKLLTIRLSFLTMWFKFWLLGQLWFFPLIFLMWKSHEVRKIPGRTMQDLSLPCQDGACPSSYHFLNKAGFAATFDFQSSEHSRIQKSKHHNVILHIYFTAMFCVQLGGGWGSCQNVLK